MIELPILSWRHIAGSGIGAADMGADGTAQSVGINVEQEAVEVKLTWIDSGQRSADFQVAERPAVEAAPDGRLGKRFRRYVCPLRFLRHPFPKATHILGQLSIDEIGSVAPEIVKLWYW
jgi:hypothetical protein